MPFRIIYVSSHILPIREDGGCEAFNQITEEARLRNALAGVSFFLVCTPHWFCQVLEGSEPAVRRTMSRIATDRRHFDCQVIQATKQIEKVKLAGFATVHKSIENRLIFLERGFSRAIVPYDRSASDLLDLCNALHGSEEQQDVRSAEYC